MVFQKNRGFKLIRPFNHLLLILGGLTFGFLLTEAISSFWLPKPVEHKLPFLHMQPDPVCGYRFRPNQKGYTLASPVSINRWGFRGLDWKPDADPHVIRVAVLGDSCVFGEGVGDGQTFPAQLEQMLNANSSNSVHYEVLNFGISGYDLGHELNVLRHHVLSFHPHIVILTFYINDIFYVKDYGFYPQLFLEENRRFSILKWNAEGLLRRSRVCSALWDLVTGQDAHGIQSLYADAIQNTHSPESSLKAEWAFVSERMCDFSHLALTHDFAPFFVVIPTPEEFKLRRSAPYVDYLKTLASRYDITFAEIFEHFKRSGQSWGDWLIPYNYHLNQNGNQLVAEALFPYIQRVLKRNS